ncbi:UNVERIFIED_ORG: asparaginase [Burkholderia sp. CF145]
MSVAATVYRGDIVENTHIAHVAVVDTEGALLYSYGDPSRFTLVRSAAKPAQALAVVESGALERFGFDDADLALMCGSHSSEDRHIERARHMLAKSQATEADLRCGGHPPISDAVYREWIKRDFIPGAVCSNCSGKHAGMLAGARAIGAALADYHLPEHPLQRLVKRTVADACDLPDDGVQWAVDGCNLPTPAFPLDRLARLYMKLARAADGHVSTDSTRDAALAQIFRAMTGYPDGRGRRAVLHRVDGRIRRRAGGQGRRGRELCNRRARVGADGEARREGRARHRGESGRRQLDDPLCDRR